MIHDTLEKKSGILREPIPAGLGNLNAHGMPVEDPVLRDNKNYQSDQRMSKSRKGVVRIETSIF